MFSEVQTNCAELFIDCLTNCMLEASEGRCQKEPLISQIWGSKKNVDTSEVFFLLQNEAKFVHAMFIANFASFLSYDHGLEPCLASWEKWFARQFFLSLAFCRHKSGMSRNCLWPQSYSATVTVYDEYSVFLIAWII